MFKKILQKIFQKEIEELDEKEKSFTQLKINYEQRQPINYTIN